VRARPYGVAVQAVFTLMGADPQVELVHRVLRWVADRGLSEFSRRDAFCHLCGSQLPKVTGLDPALVLLVAHDYLAPVASDRNPAGGRPSQRFRVNPLAQNPQNPQNRGPARGSGGSGGFVLTRLPVEAPGAPGPSAEPTTHGPRGGSGEDVW
jgi:hypothetical protein